MVEGVIEVREGAPTRLVNRNFVLLWQGQAISQLGNQAFSIATAFWTLEATGSAGLMGLIFALINLPMTVLAPLGGAVADRFSRIRILVFCDAVSALCLLVMAVAMQSGRVSRPTLVVMLFAVALVWGVLGAFFQPALSACIPDLVPAEKLGAANSLNMVAFQATGLLGQGIGGVLFKMFGAPRLFLFDGLSFLFAAGSEALVRVPPRSPSGRLGLAEHMRQFTVSIREGFAYIRGTPGLLPFMIAPASYNAFAMAVFPLLPFYVRSNLHAGVEYYGFLMAALSLGSIAGFGVAGLIRVTGEARGRLLVVTLVLSPCPLFIEGWVHSPPLALLVAFMLGLVLGVINVNLLTMLQAGTPAELRGRVLGVWTALAGAVGPLGMAAGGFIGDLTGKNLPIYFTACGVIPLIIISLTVSRRSTRKYLASF